MAAPKRPDAPFWVAMNAREKSLIEFAMEGADNCVRAAAAALGIDFSYLFKLCHKHGIPTKQEIRGRPKKTKPEPTPAPAPAPVEPAPKPTPVEPPIEDASMGNFEDDPTEEGDSFEEEDPEEDEDEDSEGDEDEDSEEGEGVDDEQSDDDLA